MFYTLIRDFLSYFYAFYLHQFLVKSFQNIVHLSYFFTVASTEITFEIIWGLPTNLNYDGVTCKKLPNDGTTLVQAAKHKLIKEGRN